MDLLRSQNIINDFLLLFQPDCVALSLKIDAKVRCKSYNLGIDTVNLVRNHICF